MGGHTNVDVHKSQSRSCLGGTWWIRIVMRNHLTRGEMICFSIGEVPKLFIAIFNFDDGEEE
jgi:hypothetical protein